MPQDNPESILRRLPAFVAPDLRLRIGALIFSFDSARCGYGYLRTHADQWVARDGNADHAIRNVIVSECWRIIDQLYSARKLADGIQCVADAPAQKDFQDCSDSAAKLRNYFDHFSANILNVSRKEKAFTPPFGNISFAYLDERDRIEFEGRPAFSKYSMRYIGTSHHPMGFQLDIGPPKVAPTVGVSNFRFQANGIILEICPALDAFSALMSLIEANLGSDVEKRAALISQKTGRSVDSVMSVEHHEAVQRIFENPDGSPVLVLEGT